MQQRISPGEEQNKHTGMSSIPWHKDSAVNKLNKLKAKKKKIICMSNSGSKNTFPRHSGLVLFDLNEQILGLDLAAHLDVQLDNRSVKRCLHDHLHLHCR